MTYVIIQHFLILILGAVKGAEIFLQYTQYDYVIHVMQELYFKVYLSFSRCCKRYRDFFLQYTQYK